MGRKGVLRPLGQPGDLGWVLMAHGETYGHDLGWDGSFEALVARIVADYSAGPRVEGREAAWIAKVEGTRAGCIFCVENDRETAQLRLLLVDPGARGLGLGRQLVDTCTEFAREAGYRRMVLWTNDPLVSAARIYLAAGFTLVREEPHHSFGVDLVGQTYELDLMSHESDRPDAG